jgi:hypothetical protein
MLISEEQFLELYPRFATVAPAAVRRALDRGERQCPLTVWEDEQEEGVILYAAHLLECEWQQTTETVSRATAIAKGQVASSLSQVDYFDRTIYGQEYRALRDSLPTTTGFTL